MRGLLLFLLGFASLSLSVSANGQDPATINAARRAGMIGERFDGYVGFVISNPTNELRRQVSAINIRRRSLYSQLAARRGVSPEEVGITTACSLFKRLNAGDYYLLGQGGWRRLEAGQSAAPSYCV
jgi:uncharacterized protein YdbL (DUF1318 family)